MIDARRLSSTFIAAVAALSCLTLGGSGCGLVSETRREQRLIASRQHVSPQGLRAMPVDPSVFADPSRVAGVEELGFVGKLSNETKRALTIEFWALTDSLSAPTAASIRAAGTRVLSNVSLAAADSLQPSSYLDYQASLDRELDAVALRERFERGPFALYALATESDFTFSVDSLWVVAYLTLERRAG